MTTAAVDPTARVKSPKSLLANVRLAESASVPKEPANAERTNRAAEQAAPVTLTANAKLEHASAPRNPDPLHVPANLAQNACVQKDRANVERTRAAVAPSALAM